MWQNRGACSFLKIEIQQNKALESLGSKLLDTINFLSAPIGAPFFGTFVESRKPNTYKMGSG
ncbi:hypothetical protein ASC72_10050 [Flavobacterium sp. Root420]|nr:hypothetical protein ASC72_10050 [Flavobacterium sp. Root420]